MDTFLSNPIGVRTQMCNVSPVPHMPVLVGAIRGVALNLRGAEVFVCGCRVHYLLVLSGTYSGDAENRTRVRKPSNQMSTRVVGEHRRHCQTTPKDLQRKRAVAVLLGARRFLSHPPPVRAFALRQRLLLRGSLTSPIHYATARSGSAYELSFAFDLPWLGFSRSTSAVPRRTT